MTYDTVLVHVLLLMMIDFSNILQYKQRITKDPKRQDTSRYVVACNISK